MMRNSPGCSARARCISAFRQDAVLASFGEGGLAPLKRTIEGVSAEVPSQSGRAVSAVIRVASLGSVDENADGELRRAIAETFRGDNAKHDNLRLSLSGDGHAMRLRLAVDEPALKVLAMLINQARQ